MEVANQSFLKTIISKHADRITLPGGQTKANGFFYMGSVLDWLNGGSRYTDMYVVCHDKHNTLMACIEAIHFGYAPLCLVPENYMQNDFNIIMPVLLDRRARHQAVIVLKYRYGNGYWERALDVYYPNETLRNQLEPLLGKYFADDQKKSIVLGRDRVSVAKLTSVTYIDYSDTLYPLKDNFAPLLSLVSSLALENNYQRAQFHYSPIYAKALCTVMARNEYKDYTDANKLIALAYTVLGHHGRLYGRTLNRLVDQCIREWVEEKRHYKKRRSNQSSDDKMIDTSFNRLMLEMTELLGAHKDLTLLPRASEVLSGHVQQLDPHSVQRAHLTAVAVAITLTICVVAALTMVGFIPSAQVNLHVIENLSTTLGAVLLTLSTLALVASTASITWLWTRSQYRPSPLANTVSTLVKELDVEREHLFKNPRAHPMRVILP